MRRQITVGGIVKIAALAGILACGGVYEALHQACLTSISNGDFWWHLRVGLGILQTHALPHTGVYSQASASPWIATSWLYDVLIAVGYRLMGLRIALLAAIAFKLALAVFVFLLAGGLRNRYLPAIALTLATQYILGSLQPLPVYCSAIAFCVELLVLLESRCRDNVRYLYALPFLFLLWANLDIQFVYGVATLLLFAASCFSGPLTVEAGDPAESNSRLSPVPIAMVTISCLVATMLTPYGWKPYASFFSRVGSAANNYFPEVQSLRFRAPQDYVLLLLVMTAFLALGMRRSRDLFQIAVLALVTVLSFRSQDEVWLATIVAVAVIANAIPERVNLERTAWIEPSAATAAAALILIFAMIRYGPANKETALAKIGSGYPVAAADYIRAQRLPQPLFNAYRWGGFLAWYLPEYPVAIDGRFDLYGSDFNIQYAKMMNADLHFSSFAPLNQARTVLLERNSLLGTALPTVPGFKVAYADDLAVVLLRREQQQ